MSGKKKSGFQITSVTSDYEQQQQQQQQQQQRREQQGLVLGRPPTPGHAEPPCSSPRGAPGEEEAAAAEEEEEGGKLPNGPPQGGLLLGPGPAAVGGASSSAASRFRVVKLDQSSGEPYKRGRWTCRDSYHEAEAATEQAAAHLLAGRLGLADQCLARHPHSLDSRLEVAGLLLRPKLPAAAAGPFSPQPPRRGTAAPPHGPLLLLPPPGPPAGHHQARSLGGGGGGGGGLPGLLRPHQTPPSAGAPRSPRAAPSGRGGDPPVLVVEEAPPGPGGLPKGGVAQREAPAAEEPRHKVFSASSSSSSSPRLQPRSRPSSPAAPLFREDASPSRKTSDPFGAARLSLAQSMFGMGVGGGAHDCDEDSGTNSSMIAIDNKIEQAMDLVKSHLMFAVREEVEVLREQIKELSERNALLEQENALLRSLANADQLSCFQAQLHTAKPSSSGSSD